MGGGEGGGSSDGAGSAGGTGGKSGGGTEGGALVYATAMVGSATAKPVTAASASEAARALEMLVASMWPVAAMTSFWDSAIAA